MNLQNTILGFVFFVFTTAIAQTKTTKILINNVEVFNGKDNKTIKGNVLIENNIITKISTDGIITDRSGATQIIDGQGKFLMPGLIDAHAHITTEIIPLQVGLTASSGYIHILS